MATVTLVKSRALDRLQQLGLTVSLVERAVRRADAEVAMCTELDPPIMEGMTRWGKTSRFLREELIPRGWTYDNPRNLARTIHPSGEFAIVASTGDEMTGLTIPGNPPSTRYRKGEAMTRAVELNEQLAFDFGDGWTESLAPDSLRTWILLFYVAEHEFRTELSLPARITDGLITRWTERIILPPFPRALEPLFGDEDAYEPAPAPVVEVTRR